MEARRAVKDTKGDVDTTKLARQRVEAAKIAPGERGPVWWTDRSPDYNRKFAKNTPYRDWFAQLRNSDVSS